MPKRELVLEVAEDELERRRANWTAPSGQQDEARGYRRLFLDHVLQAGEGVDFDFLTRRPFVAKTPPE